VPTSLLLLSRSTAGHTEAPVVLQPAPLACTRHWHPLIGMLSKVAGFTEAGASPGGITSKSIADAASNRKKAKRKPVFKSRRFLVPGAVVVITFNRKSNGSLLDVTEYLQAAVERELAKQEETKAAQALNPTCFRSCCKFAPQHSWSLCCRERSCYRTCFRSCCKFAPQHSWSLCCRERSCYPAEPCQTNPAHL